MCIGNHRKRMAMFFFIFVLAVLFSLVEFIQSDVTFPLSVSMWSDIWRKITFYIILRCKWNALAVRKCSMPNGMNKKTKCVKCLSVNFYARMMRAFKHFRPSQHRISANRMNIRRNVRRYSSIEDSVSLLYINRSRESIFL